MSRPSTRSKHGTANHSDISDGQVVRQRNGFANGSASIKGASRTTFSDIFNITQRGSGADIDDRAYAIISNDKDLQDTLRISSSVAEGDSLDFPNGFTRSNFEFSAGNNKLNSTATDNPYVWGPNTTAPSVLYNDPNATVEEVPQPVHDFTIASDVKSLSAGEDGFDTNGYGVSNINNDPRKNYTGINVLKQRSDENSSSKLGEYINTSTYEYNE